MDGYLDEYLKERPPEAGILRYFNELAGDAEPLLVRYVTGLWPTVGSMREILRLAHEIRLRDASSLASVLGESHLLEIVDSSKLSRRDKQLRIRTILEARRFPEISRIKAALSTLQEELVRGSGIRFDFPGDLEGGALKVSISVRSVEEAQSVSRRLSEASAHPALGTMFDLLHGRILPQNSSAEEE